MGPEDMFFTEEKIRLRVDDLARLRYRDGRRPTEMKFQLSGGGPQACPNEMSWESVEPGFGWEGRDLYAWLSVQVEIPSSWRGRDVVGCFDFGSTGSGHNSGFESLLLIDGNPYQGVDQNHKEVFFGDPHVGRSMDLMFMLWSGLEGGGQPTVQYHRLAEAFVACLEPAADDLYFWLKIVLETLEVLAPDDPARVDLLSLADRSFLLIDWTNPGSAEFYDSVVTADQAFVEGLGRLSKRAGVSVSCVGHSHIDVAWLWRLKHTREKVLRTFSTTLRLMERYPEYVFLQTQPQLYAYVKEDSDHLYQQIKQRVAEGRWEADGAMWLEADCNVTSGESLVRQILLGTRFFRQELGSECSCLWLPDVFGYNAALPQIMKLCGINTFMTTKISWSMYNRFPYDTFLWKGLDGSEVLAHLVTTPTAKGRHYTYNGNTDPASLVGVWKEYKQKRLNKDLLVCYGHGDGGGGPTREMIERIRRTDKVPGLPRVKPERVSQYFRRLHETLTSTDQFVPKWDGELYLEIHRGTYTSQAYNKMMNRRLELRLREAEWLGVTACVMSGDQGAYDRQKLDRCWKTVLRNQFHDIIPGSSINEVYVDSRAEYAEVQDDLDRVEQHALDALSWTADGGMVLLNSAPWPRADYVLLPPGGSGGQILWRDSMGKALEAQDTEDGTLLRVEDVPPLGFATIHADESGGPPLRAAERFSLNGRHLETPYYLVEWNDWGQLVRLYDRENDREVLAPGRTGNVLQLFDDRPLSSKDAWGLELYYQGKHEEVRSLTDWRLKESGPLRCVVSMVWRYNKSTVAQDVCFYAHSRRIDFQTSVDWQETRKLLKAAFPVAIRSTEATYDIQFGNVRRPTHWNTSWDYAQFEVPAHQWADLSQREYGVSLLNDSKYGYDIHENLMRISLLKSPIFPDVAGDKGRQVFTYSLLPHAGDWVEGQTVEQAWYLNAPLRVVPGSLAGPRFSVFTVDRANVMVDAVKKSEDSDRVVLRVHEYTGATCGVCVTSDLKILGWQPCDLCEQPVGPRQAADRIVFQIGPYQIRSFLVEMDR